MNPLIAALPAAGRAVVGPVMAAVARGASGAEVQRLVRAAGQPFSFSGPWGRILRAAREASRYSQNIKSVNRDKRINVERLPIAMGSTRRKYSYTVRLDLMDEEGDLFERFITVSTDDPSKRVGEILRAAEDVQISNYGADAMTVINTVLQGGTRRYE